MQGFAGVKGVAAVVVWQDCMVQPVERELRFALLDGCMIAGCFELWCC